MSTWLTFRDIADELRIPVKSVYLYHQRGDGPPVHKFGKHLRVDPLDYAAWKGAHK